MSVKLSVKQMLNEIRKVISQCTAPEAEVYEALMDEAADWEMRLDELEREEEDDEKA